MLVNIDVRLSIMACKWAQSCKKFALASLPTSLIIGYYSPELKAWTAVVKEKIANNPIVSIDFHPTFFATCFSCCIAAAKIMPLKCRHHNCAA